MSLFNAIGQWLRGERWIVFPVERMEPGRAWGYWDRQACFVDHRHSDGSRHPCVPTAAFNKAWVCAACRAERDLEWSVPE